MASPAGATHPGPTTVVQMNVFEDGLTDTPAAIGFSQEFGGKLAALLAVLSDDGVGRKYLGFKSARDLSVLPAVTPIDTPARFLGHLNQAYEIIYHPLGGEAFLDAGGPGDERNTGKEPTLGNALRTLYFCAEQDEAGRWTTPEFETQLGKAMAGASDAGAARAMEEGARALRADAFDATCGTLSWSRAASARIWKRENNVWRDKWLGATSGLPVFLRPTDTPEQATALAGFCRHGEESVESGGGMQSLLHVQLDADGAPLRITTLTLRSGVTFLLRQLCDFSLRNEAAATALCAFTGAAEAPGTAEARAAAVSELVMAEVAKWRAAASVECRATMVWRTLAQTSASVVMAEEFNAPWRYLPLPDPDVVSGRRFVSARALDTPRGRGEATVLFDANEYEPADLPGLEVPGYVRSVQEQGGGEAASAYLPKSSCMVLLRRRSPAPKSGGDDGCTLLLAVAVHLESAPPSDGKKVRTRRAQLRAVLGEISLAGRALAAAGMRCAVALGGDFNALKEEFVFGNGEAFFASPGAAAVHPALRRPVDGQTLSEAEMGSELARIGDSGGLTLACEGADGGELWEASHNPATAGEVQCTRAGKAMLIDFVFAGSFGGGGQLKTAPHPIASAEETAEAANEEYGIHSAVLRFGSDHLPVAADFDF